MERLQLAWLERQLDPAFRARYLTARQRNHRVNRAFLGWPARGVAELALLGMDDSRTEGFNVQERQALEPLVGPGCAILPGADELALLLLARQATAYLGRVPRVALHVAPAAFGARVTRYEDRSVEALVRAHCAVLGITPELVVGEMPPAGSIDLHLFVHGSPRQQAEAAGQVGPSRPGRRHREAARKVASMVEAGAQVAIADLGYANGGDRAFVQALGEALPLVRLAAYAGWNTAGNTVGTALAHGVMRWLSLGLSLEPREACAAAEAHAGFLLERLVDDVAYQARVRQEVTLGCTARGLNVYDLGGAHREVEEGVRSRLQDAVRDLVARHFAGQPVVGAGGLRCTLPSGVELAITLPWPRLFEVEVAVRWVHPASPASEGRAAHG